MVGSGVIQGPRHGSETGDAPNEHNRQAPRQSPSPQTVSQRAQLTRSNNLEESAAGHDAHVQPAPVSGFGQTQIFGAHYPMPPLHPATSPALITHNLIPPHLCPFDSPAALATQNQILAASWLHGTPGHRPALIAPGFVPLPLEPQKPVLTVQDRPMIPPVYNGVNPNYPGVRLLNATPPIFCVEHFLASEECEFMISAAKDAFTPAPVVGKGAGEISPSRTSSTCYLAREDVPDLLRKVALLTGKPVHHCELPQVGRYQPTQQYLQHFDAFDLATEDGQRFAANGGQRTVTVLIYLNDVSQGGHTKFPVLNLQVQPKRGMALVFFPATIDGLLDKMALHAALPAVDPKFVSQVWIRQGEYKGQPSKRLTRTLGVPFGQEPVLNGFVNDSGVTDMTF